MSGPRRLDPRQVTVWRIGAGISALVVVVVAALVDVGARVGGADPPFPPGLVAGLLALGAVALVWRLPRVAYERWAYELAPTSLVLSRGVLTSATTAIPYFRVQHIDITRSPFERALGLSQLVVRTAAATTDATIPGVAVRDADVLRDVILARTGGGPDV